MCMQLKNNASEVVLCNWQGSSYLAFEKKLPSPCYDGDYRINAQTTLV